MGVFIAALLFVLLSLSPLHAADHAVVLLYHHVSTDTPASTSVSPEIFREHLNYLKEEGFSVLPLSQILKTLAQGGSLPNRSVSITFDDAYRSVYEQAMPMLKERGWPFTVFVNTLAIDRGFRNYLDWDELKRLVDAGAEIGNHSHAHAHLVRRLEYESEQQWQDRVTEDITYARQRLQIKLGVDTDMFAYPYGEHTPELQELIGELGYFGVAQQSGAVGHGFNRQAVPRFPMATNHADMDRFSISVNSRPLPVTDVSSGPVVQVAGTTSRYKLTFTILPADYQPATLACFNSSGERLALMRKEEEAEKRFFVHLPDWGAGRRKINCTAPSSMENGVYYWFSNLWLVKQPDGKWYSE